MSYLTFTEYQQMGGTLEETAFNRLSYKASRKIDRRTFNRLHEDTEVSEPVKRLMFELIGIISNNDTSSESFSPAIASEGNDGYSISYASSSFLSPDAVEKKIDSLIEEYLQFEKSQKGQFLLSCGLGSLR